MTDNDSYNDMLTAVQAFHDKHDFRNTGGEELTYRIALMTEELGEISSCVTKGKNRAKLAEECADLLILLLCDLLILLLGDLLILLLGGLLILLLWGLVLNRPGRGVPAGGRISRPIRV